jgi:hypothetical protein
MGTLIDSEQSELMRREERYVKHALWLAILAENATMEKSRRPLYTICK